MSKNTISIKKIAELAGTSVATVSRVINHNGRYSKETEEKILQIMEEYNYQPNYLAKALRENKTNLIGIIIPDITNMFFAKIYRAIELELYQHGYLPVLCDTNEDKELEEKYIENLNYLRFAGLICLNGTQLRLPSNLPTLYVDRQPEQAENEDIYFIGCDNFQGGYLATEALIKSGRKHISMIIHDKLIATQKERYNGFARAMQDYGIPLNPDYMLTVEQITYNDGYAITGKLFDKTRGIDGIFYSSDILAIGGLNYLKDHGISVPEDVSLIGFDDIPLSAINNLTTIQQQTALMGQTAARTIIDLIHDRKVEKKQITEVKLIERRTHKILPSS